MTNAEIGAVFIDIAARLKARKENIFKIRAYEKAAGYIMDWPVSVEQMAKEGRLREVPGVGDAIEKKITELVTTGRLEFYEKLKNS
jgi:DNA polymerase (family 10)